MIYSILFKNIISAIYLIVPFLVFTRTRKSTSFLISIFTVPLYLLGMFRATGVDVDNYRRLYENDKGLYDVGFNLFMIPFKLLGLPLEFFLLSIGLINIFLVYQVVKTLKLDFGIVFLILLLHLIIVRDFAQLRIGLAVNLALYSYFCMNRGRYIVYLIAVSIHLSVVVLPVIFTLYNFICSGRLLGGKMLLSVLVWPLIFINLPLLASVDPRIEIYMAMQRPLYGEKVTSFAQPMFITFLLLVYIFQNTDNFLSLKIIKPDIFVYSLLHALVIFISFSSYSIFSYRLTNVALSLYPFFIAKLIKNKEVKFTNRLLILAILIFLLEQRDNKGQILEAIGLPL